MGNKEVIFGIDDKPGLTLTILAGVQHVLTLFGATTLVPLIFGQQMMMSPLQVAAFVGCVYFGMGVATLVQTHPRLGSGLPIVQGSSFSFIAPILAIATMYSAQGPGVTMQYVGGALIAGGLVLAFIGYTGLMGTIRKIITPVVIGPTIMAIGFSLAPTAIQSASNAWPIALTVVVLAFTFNLVVKNRLFNMLAILAAITVAYLICLFGTLVGIFSEGHGAFVNFAAVAEAPWLHLDILLPWGVPKFSVQAIGAISAGFICATIESIGDYHSCAFAAGIDDPTEVQVSRGIGAEGVGCIISGLFGSVGTTSYTENIGLIGLTGVASRHVVRVGAIILIAVSFVGKIGAVVATMPSSVMGGVYITLFGVIGAMGIQNLSRADMTSQRNILIVGFAFLMSQGLPAWVEPNMEIFTSALGGTLGSTVWSILKTPMAVAAICAATCDSLVPGTPEERGIAGRRA